MSKEAINIVWLKRDLRTQDHASFFEAENANLPYLIVFIYEPSIISYQDTSLRHLQFQYHSIKDLNQKFKLVGKAIHVCHAEAQDVFSDLVNKFEIKNIYSYQESGTMITFKRDLALKLFFESNNIKWTEFQRDGIQRGIKNRKTWDKDWFVTMTSKQIENDYSENKSVDYENIFHLNNQLKQDLETYPSTYQPAGETMAYKYLMTFVKDRSKNYSKHISKPLESRKSCSRLSPYLAWGNLSIRQAFQLMYIYYQQKTNAFGLNNAMTRLKWHCHFIQKFENQCDYEIRNLNAGYDEFDWDKSADLLEAWKQGKTGIPMVDACMRSVNTTGWLNFRMRAMLVSVLSHHFLLDWKSGVYHLSNQFLDYEPGIHFTQFQMQAGTTGVNTIRVYNPIKQSEDQDPDGIFIKTWCPELHNVPVQFIHTPWLMTLLDQELCGVILGENYPKPILDIDAAIKQNRPKLWSHKKSQQVKVNNKKILEQHVRPNQ